MELRTCPGPNDKGAAAEMIHRIATDINMQPLDTPRVYYMKHPEFNEGLTAIMPIQTSHIAFHFWNRPNPKILKSRNGKCLLEFDIYTCGSLSFQQIQKVLHHLSVFEPTRVDATVINRKISLAIDHHMHWSEETGEEWSVWVSRLAPQKGGDSLNDQIADLQKRKARLEAMLRNPQRIRMLINSEGFPEAQEHQVRHVQTQLQDVVFELNLLERSRRSRNADPTNPNENEDPQPPFGGKRNTRRLRW